MFDLNHSFFKPLWRRILVVAITLGWVMLEWSTGNPGWAIMFFGVGVYAAWSFFIKFEPREADDLNDDREDVKND